MYTDCTFTAVFAELVYKLVLHSGTGAGSGTEAATGAGTGNGAATGAGTGNGAATGAGGGWALAWDYWCGMLELVQKLVYAMVCGVDQVQKQVRGAGTGDGGGCALAWDA
jgi:hypothetical protein